MYAWKLIRTFVNYSVESSRWTLCNAPLLGSAYNASLKKPVPLEVGLSDWETPMADLCN